MSAHSALSESLFALRAAVRAIETGTEAENRACLPFGLAALDSRLEGGGLALAALHEIAAAQTSPADDAAASLFIAGIAARCPGNVLWALSRRDLFAPGLARAGLGPER